MASPLLATRRLEMRYQVHGFPHKQRAYAIPLPDVLGVKQIQLRDSSTQNWTAAADAMGDALSEIYNAADIDSIIVELQDLVGTVWVDLEAYTPTPTYGAAGTWSPASQLTFVINDTSGKKIRVNYLEAAQGYVGHSGNGLGINAHISAVASFFVLGGEPPTSQFYWQVSRSNLYMATGVPIAGATLDLNDKVKRSRHLE